MRRRRFTRLQSPRRTQRQTPIRQTTRGHRACGNGGWEMNLNSHILPRSSSDFRILDRPSSHACPPQINLRLPTCRKENGSHQDIGNAHPIKPGARHRPAPAHPRCPRTGRPRRGFRVGLALLVYWPAHPNGHTQGEASGIRGKDFARSECKIGCRVRARIHGAESSEHDPIR